MNVLTTLVIAVEMETVCDCGPEVSVPDIVQDDTVVELTDAATTFIDPLKDADAVPLEAVTI